MYHFLSGYTAKVAGTEKGVKDPSATFSTCFGAPFLPLNPNVYARGLGERIARHKSRVWLVNTGWTGGPFGVGSRMSIAHTRAMITAALSGALDNVGYQRHPIFNLEMPTSLPGRAGGGARSAQHVVRQGRVRRAGEEARDDVRRELQDLRRRRRHRPSSRPDRACERLECRFTVASSRPSSKCSTGCKLVGTLNLHLNLSTRHVMPPTSPSSGSRSTPSC